LLYFWNNLTSNLKALNRNKNQIVLPNDFPNGISFGEQFIVVKRNERMKIFSSKCSHLGCRINNSLNDDFICPCHGSKFNSDGEVLKGPAMKNLIKLKYRIDNSKNQIIIYI
jgi:Rieske Fe-S protein